MPVPCLGSHRTVLSAYLWGQWRKETVNFEPEAGAGEAWGWAAGAQHVGTRDVAGLQRGFAKPSPGWPCPVCSLAQLHWQNTVETTWCLFKPGFEGGLAAPAVTALSCLVGNQCSAGETTGRRSTPRLLAGNQAPDRAMPLASCRPRATLATLATAPAPGARE